ncbi:carbonic anhydrase 2-like isoform X2 [Biomphalaria pfeifferi]|uniref:carbonic anhydrase n=1 Tax=Biomphalaria pfeifferi TaxID=112525 RepID=A0AAD8BHZ1_BIOPF|nr:carbonic anhydrase 2-like isoform X2 [Biomphalaria pfeifferi]
MTLRNYIFFVSLCVYMEQQSVVLATVLVTNDAWSYSGENGPDTWHHHYPLCQDTNASLQSPIDIDTDQVKYSTHCEPFRFDGYNRIWNNIMLMTNNGRSVRINIVGNMTLSRGGLDGTYRASHIHLHWGSENSRGSEHTINGKAYPLEASRRFTA